MSGFVITGYATRTSAGADIQQLWAHLEEGKHGFCEVPEERYSCKDFGTVLAAIIPGLNDQRPAEVLLEQVFCQAMSEAEITCGPAIDLVVATSLGNISGPWEGWHRSKVDANQDIDLGDIQGGLDRHGPALALKNKLSLGGCITVSVACASGSAAFLVALGRLMRGDCEAVVVAGVDVLSAFVHGGFDALGALSTSLPQPFCEGRDGLLLGEGAAAVVLQARERVSPESIKAHLVGVGMASDAFHLTRPDPEGLGCAKSIQQALRGAGIDPQDIAGISVHGTATKYNDNMEFEALKKVFAPTLPPLHGVKHAIGHCLGAAGVIEAVVAIEAMNRGYFANEYPLSRGLEGSSTALAQSTKKSMSAKHVLSTNSAFGGVNAAVLFSKAPRSHDPEFYGGPLTQKCLVDRSFGPGPSGFEPKIPWRVRPHRYGKIEPYCQIALCLLEEARAEGLVLDEQDALVLCTRMACRSVDLAYHEDLIQQGPEGISRRQFAHTVPGAALAHAAVHYGLKGPQLSISCTAELAREQAESLIRLKLCEQVALLFIEFPRRGDSGFGALQLYHKG